MELQEKLIVSFGSFGKLPIDRGISFDPGWVRWISGETVGKFKRIRNIHCSVSHVAPLSRRDWQNLVRPRLTDCVHTSAQVPATMTELIWSGSGW